MHIMQLKSLATVQGFLLISTILLLCQCDDDCVHRTSGLSCYNILDLCPFFIRQIGTI